MQKPFITEDEEHLTRALAPLGLVLCGGYSRDILLGRTPRDMDFILLNSPGVSQQTSLEARWPEIHGTLEVLGAEITHLFVEYAASAWLVCVAKVEYRGIEFQILLPRNAGAELPREAVEQFQWNFNHAYFDTVLWEHVWAEGVKLEVRNKMAVWKCSSEPPVLAAKYRRYFPDWDFSLYAGS